MKLIIGCEESDAVRGEFERMGHDAYSCDYLPSANPENRKHIQGDVLGPAVTRQKWDFGGFHPTCTFLTVSANKWFDVEWRTQARLSALHFVMALWALPIPRLYIENPIGVLSTFWRRPDQIIQPWQFGHPECKATCLWLRGLPKLEPTNIVKDQMETLPKSQAQRLHYLPPSPDRTKIRSRTYKGIAQAMAEQWGNL